MKDGYLTLLVVPEDEHRVRQIRISYRALRRLAGLGVAVGVMILIGLSLYGSVLIRAGRVALLERENRRLAAEGAKVARLIENLERSERTYEQIRSLMGLEELPARAEAAGDPGSEASMPAPEERSAAPEETSPPTSWPLAVKGFVTARYAEPVEHTGIDIAIPAETPVLATAPGRVTEAGFDSILGHYVVLVHEGGLETLYGHNARLLVAEGQSVERAEPIALSGNSGRSTAPHLHYEVREAGRAVDPDPYLHAGLEPR